MGKTLEAFLIAVPTDGLHLPGGRYTELPHEKRVALRGIKPRLACNDFLT